MSVDTSSSDGGRAPLGRRRTPLDRRSVDRIVAQLRLAGQRTGLGERQPRRARRSTSSAATAREVHPETAQSIGAARERARRETGMDVALLGEIRDGQEVVCALAGRGDSFGLRVGASIPIEATYCHLLLQGRLRNVVADSASEDLVKHLPLTRQANVGAYIGVPLTTLDARLYMLCCLAHEQRPSLTGRHVRLLRDLAQSIAPELAR
jgi:GAF domain-containing protein